LGQDQQDCQDFFQENEGKIDFPDNSVYSVKKKFIKSRFFFKRQE
jgi:hypothetical protein